MFYEKEFLDHLNSTIDIVSLINEYIDLKKDGSTRLSGNCPFKDHEDKNASFKVFAHTNSWYCYGCKKGTNVIHFLQEINGLSFEEAVDFLCKKLNIQKPKNRTSPVFDFNKKTQIKYSYYLKRNFQNSYDFLISRGVNDRAILAWGLGANNENRITFPFYDRNHNILGFSKRYIITPENASDKYWHPMNSCNYKETDFRYGDYYSKSKYLYGIHLYNRKSESPFIYFTEGNLDVILAWQYNLENCLALLGSAFTDAHLTFLQSTNKSPVFILDNDEAGIKGMHTACKKCMEVGIAPHVVLLKPGMDLADTSNYYQEKLLTYIHKQIRSYSFYLIESTLACYKKDFYSFQQPYFEAFRKNLNILTDEEKTYATHFIKQETGISI